MKQFYITLFYSVFIVTGVYTQQLPYRTAFTTADFIWNPSMTSTSYYLDWGGAYRQQWLGFEGAPSTALAYFQLPFVEANMSAGGWAISDKTGPLQYYQVGGSYAYKINLGAAGQLSIGLSGMMSQFQFDGTELPAVDPDDPLLINSRSSMLSPNIGLGFCYVSNIDMYTLNDNGFFIGIGSNQLLTSELNFEEQNKRTALDRALHVNGLIGARFINGYSFFEPSLWVDYAQEGLFYARGNLLFEQEEAFWAGTSFASDYTLSLQAGIILKDWIGEGSLRIGGMGSYSIGNLGNYQGAGFEVMIAYRYWR